MYTYRSTDSLTREEKVYHGVGVGVESIHCSDFDLSYRLGLFGRGPRSSEPDMTRMRQ